MECAESKSFIAKNIVFDSSGRFPVAVHPNKQIRSVVLELISLHGYIFFETFAQDFSCSARFE